MSHFAQLDENNTVLQVIVVNNTELAVYSTVTNNGYIEEIQTLSELKGIEFCQSLYGPDTNWRQTSYNNKFRGKYAAIGDVYDADADVFRDPNVVNSPDVPVIEPVVETQQEVALETQAPVELTSADLTALSSVDIYTLSSADIPAMTSEQISGLE
jgi:hypothetical protein